MANKKINLTAQRRAELKQQVLEELEKKVLSKSRKVNKKVDAGLTMNVKQTTKKELPVKETNLKKKKVAPRVDAIRLDFLKIPVDQKNEKEKKVVNIDFSTESKIVEPSSKAHRGWLKTLSLFILVVLVLIVVIDVLTIYKFSWRDKFSYTVAKILFLPAGTVNGQWISLTEYFDDLETLKYALSKDREGMNAQLFSNKKIEEQIFYRLVASKLVEKELAKRQQSVGVQELSSDMEEIIKQVGDQQKAIQTIKDLYNLNLEQFKDKVLKFVVEREKLEKIVSQDESLPVVQETKARAVEALNLALKPSVDFETLVKQFTDDEAGINTGGDLGWVAKGEANKEIETVLFSLPDNTVYNQLVKSNLGYHIFKVEKKAVNPETGKESVKVRQILIKVNIDQYIKSLIDQAKIIKFVN